MKERGEERGASSQGKGKGKGGEGAMRCKCGEWIGGKRNVREAATQKGKKWAVGREGCETVEAETSHRSGKG